MIIVQQISVDNLLKITFQDIPEAYFPYLGILKNVYCQMNTAHYTYGELCNEINLATLCAAVGQSPARSHGMTGRLHILLHPGIIFRKYLLQPSGIRHIRPTPGQVDFVCRAGNFKKKGLPYTGALTVLQPSAEYPAR